MILCPGKIAKLRQDTPRLLRDLGILLEPTIFGIAISGRVPEVLRKNIDSFSFYNIFPRVAMNLTGPLFKVEEDKDMILRENL